MTRKTYAALWAESDDSTPLVGSLTLGPHSLTFEGKNEGREALQRVRYSDITSIALDRSQSGRLAGRTAMVLAVSGRRVRLALPETGALHELAETLTSAHAIGGTP